MSDPFGLRAMHHEAAALAHDAKALLGHGEHEGWAFRSPADDQYAQQRMYCGCGAQLLPLVP